MNRITLAALAASTVLFAGSAQAQQDFSKVQIKTTDLGNRTYMLEGQGGNIVVACGDDAVIQVDTEFAPLHDKIKAAIDQACGGKPIKYIVNTHFHGDHTGGNGEFATKDKATVVAHHNLALRLEHGSTNGLSGQKHCAGCERSDPDSDLRFQQRTGAPSGRPHRGRRTSEQRTYGYRFVGFLPGCQCARDG